MCHIFSLLLAKIAQVKLLKKFANEWKLDRVQARRTSRELKNPQHKKAEHRLRLRKFNAGLIFFGYVLPVGFSAEWKSPIKLWMNLEVKTAMAVLFLRDIFFRMARLWKSGEIVFTQPFWMRLIYPINIQCILGAYTIMSKQLSCDNNNEAAPKIIYHTWNIDFDANVVIKSSDKDILIIILEKMHRKKVLCDVGWMPVLGIFKGKFHHCTTSANHKPGHCLDFTI